MSPNIDPVAVSVGIAAAVLILLATLPALNSIIQKLWHGSYTSLESLPEDQDGEATEESISSYSTTVQMTAIYTASVVGLVASTVKAVISTTQDSVRYSEVESWFQFGTFVCTFFFLPPRFFHALLIRSIGTTSTTCDGTFVQA